MNWNSKYDLRTTLRHHLCITRHYQRHVQGGVISRHITTRVFTLMVNVFVVPEFFALFLIQFDELAC